MTDDYNLKGKRVFVAGHRGMAGSAIVRRLAAEHCEILVAGRDEVDLRRQADVEAWVEGARPPATRRAPVPQQDRVPRCHRAAALACPACGATSARTST